MAVDALAPYITRSSSAMIQTVCNVNILGNISLGGNFDILPHFSDKEWCEKQIYIFLHILKWTQRNMG